jgi:hypothetical protein
LYFARHNNDEWEKFLERDGIDIGSLHGFEEYIEELLGKKWGDVKIYYYLLNLLNMLCQIIVLI